MKANIYHTLATLGILIATATVAHADDEALINQAVQRGVAHLRTMQAPDGSWVHGAHVMGPTSLAGVTLLECGVRKDDPAVQRALTYVRETATGNTGAGGADQTYDIALAIIFLDRFGSMRDVPVIESLTVRLLAGQNSQGGWTYTCPTIGSEETQRLRERMLQTSDQARDPKKRPTLEDLPKEIIAQVQQIGLVQPVGRINGTGDNSNTQFATLGLWVGHRHGLPVEPALARIEQRYKLSQNVDGGWAYMGMGGGGSKDTMTCAGLLGLAVAYGYALEKEERQRENGSTKPSKQPADLTRVPNVGAGLLALGTVIGVPVDGIVKGPPGPVQGLNLTVKAPEGFAQVAVVQGPNYYLLWSIERVAMAFDLQRIGNKDWFRWGTSVILRHQQPDGGWSGQYTNGGVDTCFALLFLSRSNLAQDLTTSLRGRVHDPGEARMRAKDGDPRGRLAKSKSALNLDLKIPENFVEPELDPKSPAGQLSQELVKATASEQATVLAKLRDSKGVVYTEALAGAIPRLTGAGKGKARDALAERLTRMSPATLRDKFKDPDTEIRRAAILAAAMSEDKTFIPDVLTLLNDPAPAVWHAVPVALKLLSGKDFGPAANATPEERGQARTRWEEWLRQSGTK